jgi:hypothetical protein
MEVQTGTTEAGEHHLMDAFVTRTPSKKMRQTVVFRLGWPKRSI